MYSFKKGIGLVALSTLFVLGMDMSSLNAAIREGGSPRGEQQHQHGQQQQHHNKGNQQHHENYEQNEHHDYNHEQNNSTVVVPVNEGDNNDNNGSNWDPNAANPQTQGAQIFDQYDPNNR